MRPTDDNQPFSSWPEPRCKCVFAAFVDLELHLDVGEHDVEVQTKGNVYDKIRRDWACMFTTVQKEKAPTNRNRNDEASRSETGEEELQMGWAMHKSRGGKTHFSQQVREYLTLKFDLGEKTGQKADSNQVSRDMRNARTVGSKRLFSREEWLTGTQIQGFFSRLASARRRRNNAQQSLVSENEDVEDTHEQEHNAMVEEVISEIGLKHPIIFDVYNICEYHHNGKLSLFNVSMLRDMCRYFELSFKSRDVKKELLKKVSAIAEECSCNKK